MRVVTELAIYIPTDYSHRETNDNTLYNWPIVCLWFVYLLRKLRLKSKITLIFHGETINTKTTGKLKKLPEVRKKCWLACHNSLPADYNNNTHTSLASHSCENSFVLKHECEAKDVWVLFFKFRRHLCKASMPQSRRSLSFYVTLQWGRMVYNNPLHLPRTQIVVKN